MFAPPFSLLFYEQLSFHMQVSWTISPVGMKGSILLLQVHVQGSSGRARLQKCQGHF